MEHAIEIEEDHAHRSPSSGRALYGLVFERSSRYTETLVCNSLIAWRPWG